jgi:hypothetical protein
MLELHLEGVTVEHLDALEGRVVVELVLLARFLEERLRAEDGALDLREQGRGELRVHQPLDRIDVVLRRQLPLLPAERRVVVEVDARLYAKRVGLPAVGDFGHGGEGVGLELEGPHEVVVGHRRVEDRVDDEERVHVRDLLRVECRLRDFERPCERPCSDPARRRMPSTRRRG